MENDRTLCFFRYKYKATYIGGKFMNGQYFKEFFNKSPNAYSYHRKIVDEQGIPYDYEFLAINEAYEKIMGVKSHDVINKRFYEVFPKGWEGESQWKKTFNEAIRNQTSTHFDMHHVSIQKRIRVTVFPLDGDIFACIYNDVTREYMLDNEIQGILTVNPDMLCVANTDGEFIKVNQQFEQVLGYTVDELEGESFVSLVHPDDIPSTLNIVKDLEEQKSISSFINRVRCKGGSYRFLEWRSQPNGKFIYASARDITEKRLKEMNLIQLTEELQKQNESLETLAVTDELTGLYNRHYIDIKVEEEMNYSDCQNTPLSLIILDLDHFKQVNDIWGHPVGDEVLKKTADLTQSIVRKSDILARFGGEEFVIFMPKTDIHVALVVAEKIRQAMEKTHYPLVGGITASFGVAARKKNETFYNWYKRADEALYSAKKGGRNLVICSNQNEDVSVASVNLSWKCDWESGHKQIDEQHQELVKQGDLLIHMSLSNAGYEKILHQLEIVLNHIVEHFKSEEQILMDIGYPDYETHATIHKNLVQQALKLKENYQNGELKSSAFFSFIVDEIVIGHMIEKDKEFFPYIPNSKKVACSLMK